MPRTSNPSPSATAWRTRSFRQQRSSPTRSAGSSTPSQPACTPTGLAHGARLLKLWRHNRASANRTHNTSSKGTKVRARRNKAKYKERLTGHSNTKRQTGSRGRAVDTGMDPRAQISRRTHGPAARETGGPLINTVGTARLVSPVMASKVQVCGPSQRCSCSPAPVGSSESCSVIPESPSRIPHDAPDLNSSRASGLRTHLLPSSTRRTCVKNLINLPSTDPIARL